MSEWIEVRHEHKVPAMNGLFTFDGRVVEVFGFNDVHSVRLPVSLIEGAELSFDKGLISQPSITFRGRGGGQGYTKAIDPPDELKPELESFAAAVTAAAVKSG
ncbi:MAG TPA: hypothetical protein VMF31_09765 [Solirubrobacterales bacterium]|nr:hypothetical protein [Solirubrobacterales bacterium]